MSNTIIQIISLLSTVVSLCGNVLVNYQKKEGYMVWILSNILWVWMVLSMPVINWGQLSLFIIYTATSIQGLVIWTRKEKERKQNENK